MRDAVTKAREAGERDGRLRATHWLFAGAVDNDVVVEISRRLRDGDSAALESMPTPQEDGRPYPPNHLTILGPEMTVDSPYSWYLDVCDAYDNAFNRALIAYIHKIADAIKEGIL